MNTAIDSDDGNMRLRKLAEKGLAEWKQLLKGILSEGVKRKEIKPSTDPSAVANNIVALLEGSLMITRLEQSTRALSDAKSMLASVLAVLTA